MTVRVEIRLPGGTAIAEIETDRAPLSAAAFLALVDAGEFDGAHIYRRVRSEEAEPGTAGIDVVQFGLGIKQGGVFTAPPIPHESTAETGMRHESGSLSLARLEPGTARSEIFVTLRCSPELDFGGARQPDGQGFAVFGRIVEGLELFADIHRNGVAEFLPEAIEIQSVRRTPPA